MRLVSKCLAVALLIQGGAASAAVTVSLAQTGGPANVAPGGTFQVDVLVSTDGASSISGAQLNIVASETGAASVTGPADGAPPAGVGMSNAYNDTGWDIDLSQTALPMVTGSLDTAKGPYGTGADATIPPNTSDSRMATLTLQASGTSGTYHLQVSGLAFPEYPLSGPAPDDIAVTPGADMTLVVGETCTRTIADANRRLFYNNSFFDSALAACTTFTGANPCNDNSAIATDKVALNPGQVASTTSYSSYTKSINGLMIDVTLGGGCSPLPGGALPASNFEFKTGNGTNLGTYIVAAAPLSLDVTPGGGAGGSDRIVIIWANNALPNRSWLRTVVKSNANGGALDLASDNVFYFGLAIGDSLNAPAGTPPRATVNVDDEIGARNHLHGTLSRVQVANNSSYGNPANLPDVRYDYNKTSTVNVDDEITSRNNNTSTLNGLLLFTAP